jgi:hypothetical protein
MNTVQCPGCKQPFGQGKALKVHQTHCTPLHVVAKDRFRQREENIQKWKAVKMARLEGQTMEDIAEEREELWGDIATDVVDQSIEESSAVRNSKK